MSTTFFNNLALVHNLSLTGQKSVYFPHKQKQSTERCRWISARPVPNLPSTYLRTVHTPGCRIIAVPPPPLSKKKMWPVRLYDTLPKPKTSLLLPKPPKPCHSGTKRPRNTALVKEAPFTSSPRVSPLPPPASPAARERDSLDGPRSSGAGAPFGFRAWGLAGERRWASDSPWRFWGGTWPGGLSAPGARSWESQGALFLGEREETRGQSYYSAVKPLSFKEFHQNSPRIMFAQCLLSFGPVFCQAVDWQGYAAFWLFASGCESGSE